MDRQGRDALVGQVVDGRYEIVERLARGGMSTVYRAVQHPLDRDVAVKVMSAHLAADPEFVDRFEREARAAARLRHPHVVGVLDQGTDGDLVYLVMEYVPGHTLKDEIARGPMTPRRMLEVVDPIIDGLAAAHDAGFVHRDVKPENVLMGNDGRIQVADFGLTRAAAGTTSGDVLMGTVAYIAPEVLRGGDIDGRCDLYSVGIMMHEMLTGRRPYDHANQHQVIHDHLYSSVPPPSRLAPGLSEDLDELVQWCAAQEIAQRPIDAHALLEELRHIAANLPDEALDFRAPVATARPSIEDEIQGATTVLPDGRTVLVPPPPVKGPGSAPPTARPAEPVSSERAVPAQTRRVQPTERVQAAPTQQVQVKRPSKWRAKKQHTPKALNPTTPTHSLTRGNSRRRGVVMLIVVLLLAALVATGAWFFGAGPGAQVDVPDVAQTDLASAQQSLDDHGLRSGVQEVNDERVAKGTVIGTDPAAFSSVRRWQPITILLSAGPTLYAVPDLIEVPEERVASEVEAVRLEVGKVDRHWNEDLPAGVVVSQSPSAGESVRGGTAVDVVISRGPQPIDIPSVTGKTQNDAEAALREAGFVPQIAPEKVFDREVPDGSIAKQEPANTQAVRGTTITLTISKGPRMVEVPDFVGDQVDEAKAELEELGFTVEVREVLGGFFGTVRSQEPAGGTAPEGSTIVLTVV